MLERPSSTAVEKTRPNCWWEGLISSAHPLFLIVYTSFSWPSAISRKKNCCHEQQEKEIEFFHCLHFENSVSEIFVDIFSLPLAISRKKIVVMQQQEIELFYCLHFENSVSVKLICWREFREIATTRNVNILKIPFPGNCWHFAEKLLVWWEFREIATATGNGIILIVYIR